MACACASLATMLSLCAVVLSMRLGGFAQLDDVMFVVQHANVSVGADGTMALNVTGIDGARALGIHQPEAILLGTLFVRVANGSLPLMRHILQGAHVVIQGDNGAYYHLLRHLPGAHDRRSSHRSCSRQFGVPEGHTLRNVLVGSEPDHSTWFQLEGAPWHPSRRPWLSFLHMVNYLNYLACDCQIGPLGSSPHTDKRPLFVTPAYLPPPDPALHDEAAPEPGGLRARAAALAA